MNRGLFICFATGCIWILEYRSGGDTGGGLVLSVGHSKKKGVAGVLGYLISYICLPTCDHGQRWGGKPA